MSVCSSLYLLTRAHCARCSPSIPLWLASYLLAPAGGRTQSPDCALCIPVSHDRRKACLFFLSCTSVVYIKLFELGVEASESLSTTDPRLSTTKLICSNFHFGAAALSALMMLLCCSFTSASFTSRNPSSLSIDRLNSKIYTICKASLIAIPSGRLP